MNMKGNKIPNSISSTGVLSWMYCCKLSQIGQRKVSDAHCGLYTVFPPAVPVSFCTCCLCPGSSDELSVCFQEARPEVPQPKQVLGPQKLFFEAAGSLPGMPQPSGWVLLPQEQEEAVPGPSLFILLSALCWSLTSLTRDWVKRHEYAGQGLSSSTRYITEFSGMQGKVTEPAPAQPRTDPNKQQLVSLITRRPKTKFTQN